MIIEIDGSQHFTQNGLQKDEYRTEILQDYDLKIIRFTNYQIDSNLQGVCDYIDAVEKSLIEQ